MSNEIIRYHLESESKQPKFAFVLLTGGVPCVDYYIYQEDELENAIAQLKAEYAKGYHLAKLYIPKFCTHDRTWRLKEFMELDLDGKLVWMEFGETHLHVKWYLDAGEWLNKEGDV